MSKLIQVTHPNLSDGARKTLLSYLAISGIVFLLMMLVGLAMRLGQSQWIPLSADIFYQLMTLHGVGMVGLSGFAGSAIMWFFLSRHVKLSTAILVSNMVFFLVGVVLILAVILLGKFAAGWTFLYPLPAKSMGLWNNTSAAGFLLGLLLIGVGFLLLNLDVARAILAKYGNLSKSLGWPQLFSGSTELPPQAAVVASSMVLIVNILGILAGAVVLVLSLINLFNPEFALDALLVKNLIFFFGHIFINAAIYQAAIAVYEILPEYTRREWKVSKVFLAAWSASTLMVVAVYPHHLLMDFVMPTWALIMGQILSFASGIPVLVVTAFGTLTIIHRSGIRWDIASGMLMLSIVSSHGRLPGLHV